MSAMTLSTASWTAAHSTFLDALPRINEVISFAFRNWPRHRRAEAIVDAQAAAWHAWSGLVTRGQDPSSVGPTGIAANAVRYVKNGRRLGMGSRGRGAMDVYNPRAQRCRGFGIVSLDHNPTTDPDARPDAWREWLAEDHRVTPADEACFRLDFVAWLEGLPTRKREMAELLAEGQETGAVAECLGVTPSAVSQARTWLEASWRAFQGDAAGQAAPPARRPRGRPKGSGRDARGRGCVRDGTRARVPTS